MTEGLRELDQLQLSPLLRDSTGERRHLIPWLLNLPTELLQLLLQLLLRLLLRLLLLLLLPLLPQHHSRVA